MSPPLRLITALVAALLLSGCTNCEYLAWHPVATTATGQKLCARHRVPLITVHGYGHRGEDVILYHWAGMNHTVDACNPNRIDPDFSLRRTQRSSHRMTFSYCSSASGHGKNIGILQIKRGMQRFGRSSPPTRSCGSMRCSHERHLTNHWSEPLAALLRRFDFMKIFQMFVTLAPARGRSVHSR
jgi:hypothetical protein